MLLGWQHESTLMHLLASFFIANGLGAFFFHATGQQFWGAADGNTLRLGVWCAVFILIDELLEKLSTVVPHLLAQQFHSPHAKRALFSQLGFGQLLLLLFTCRLTCRDGGSLVGGPAVQNIANTARRAKSGPNTGGAARCLILLAENDAAAAAKKLTTSKSKRLLLESKDAEAAAAADKKQDGLRLARFEVVTLLVYFAVQTALQVLRNLFLVVAVLSYYL